MKRFYTSLFRQYFTSFFLFILIPAFVASVLTYSFVVSLIEEELEKSNNKAIAEVSDSTDALFETIQRDMIHLLGGSALMKFLEVAGQSPDSRPRFEAAHALMNQMRIFGADGMMMNGFIYFANHDLVLDHGTYTSKDYYFRNYFPLSDQNRTQFFAELEGKQVIQITQPYMLKPQPSASEQMSASVISMIMSFPFNKENPDVYLVVNLNRAKLAATLRVPEDWITATGIADASNQIILETAAAKSALAYLQQGTDRIADAFFPDRREVEVTYARSKFNADWNYFSVVDLQLLMKPAYLVRTYSLWFLAFFLIVGFIASYLLSRKMYTPILEIKEGLKPRNVVPERTNLARTGNDFDWIKHVSSFLQTENKELSQRVNVMQSIVQEQFVSKMLLGEFRDKFSIEMYAREVELPFDHRMSSVVYYIELNFYPSVSMSGSQKSFMLAELKENISKTLRRTVWFGSPLSHVLVSVVRQPKFEKGEVLDIAETIRAVMLDYQSCCKAVISVGSIVENVEDLASSYAHARAMLTQKSLHPTVDICHEECATDERMSWERFLTQEEVNQMNNLYKARSYDAMLQSALDWLEEGVRVNATESQAKNFCFDILNTWVKLLELSSADSGFPYVSGQFERMHRCVTWDECAACLRDIHQQWFQQTDTHELQAQFDVVLQYIHEHYGEELSIDRFASQLGMSSGHFSRMFKEVVGVKYMDYLTRYRMEKAKQLLIESDLKVDDIAERIGYYGRNSFTRVFRRMEGLTPGAYRSVHQR